MILFTLLLTLGLTRAQQACVCGCCDGSTFLCSIAGTPDIDTCGACTDTYCQNMFLTCNGAWQQHTTCGSATNSSWSGSYTIEDGGTCAPAPPVTVHPTPKLPLPTALPRRQSRTLTQCDSGCNPDPCNCFGGDFVLTDNEDGTILVSVSVTLLGGGSTVNVNATFAAEFIEGMAANGTFAGVGDYDLVLTDGTLTIYDRPYYTCIQTALLHPSTTSWWKLALIIAAVGVVVLGVLVYCFCNPCKKKKSDLEGGIQDGTPGGVTSAPYKPLTGDDIRRQRD